MLCFGLSTYFTHVLECCHMCVQVYRILLRDILLRDILLRDLVLCKCEVLFEMFVHVSVSVILQIYKCWFN